MATYKSNSYSGRQLRLEVWQSGTTIYWEIYSEGGSSTYYTIYNFELRIGGHQLYNKKTYTWTSYSFPAKVGSDSGSFTVAEGTSSIEVYFTGGVFNNVSTNWGGTLYLSWRYWNNINVIDPNGNENYSVGTFDLYTSENNRWRYGLSNEDDDMTHERGTYFQVQNIQSQNTAAYAFNYVSGHDSSPSAGAYRKTFDAANEAMNIYFKYVQHYLDVNGMLDGTYSGGVGGYGTFDLMGQNDISDYYTALNYGTSYSITDIRATTGHTYNGVYSGSTSGTITGATTVVLSFSTNWYTNSIAHWITSLARGEGNNGDRTCYHLGNTSFTASYGSYIEFNSGRAKTIPRGLYLRGDMGSPSFSGGWTSHALPFGTYQPAGDTSAEYYYVPYTYTITYNMNGGTNNSANPSTYNVYYGVTFANPTRSYYDFLGWTIDGTYVSGINPGANATFSSADDVYNKLSTRTIGNQTVVANWRETKPWDVAITSCSVTSPFTIDVSWAAGGLNISNYTVYYNGVAKNCGTATSTTLDVSEETTYNIYVVATNPGGSTSSGSVSVTTPADQAKIRRKTESGWVKGKTYYKKDGQWVKAKKIYIKIDGVWKIGTNYDFGDLTNWDSNNSTVWNINYNANTGVNTIAAQGLGGVWEQKYKLIDTVVGASYTVSLDFYNPNGYTPLSGYNGIECQAVNSISTHNDDTKIGSVLLPPAANANKQVLSFNFTATASTTYITINFGRAADNMTHSVSIGNIRVVRN